MDKIQKLFSSLQKKDSIFEKIEILNNHISVKQFLQNEHPLNIFISSLTPQCEYVVKIVIAVEKHNEVFGKNKDVEAFTSYRKALNEILEIESDYKEGLLGYYRDYLMVMPPSRY